MQAPGKNPGLLLELTEVNQTPSSSLPTARPPRNNYLHRQGPESITNSMAQVVLMGQAWEEVRFTRCGGPSAHNAHGLLPRPQHHPAHCTAEAVLLPHSATNRAGHVLGGDEKRNINIKRITWDTVLDS